MTFPRLGAYGPREGRTVKLSPETRTGLMYARYALRCQNEHKPEWVAEQNLRAWTSFSAAQQMGLILG